MPNGDQNPMIGHAAYYPEEASPNKGAAPISDSARRFLDALPVCTTMFGPATEETDKRRIAELETENAQLRAGFKEALRERLSLINGIVQADNMVGEIIDEHFDEDPPEGSQGTPPRGDLRTLQAHLSGTLIGSDGEYMPRDKFDHLLE